MFWVCTNATIDWEAISAVGTAGAAIVALLVWLSDRWSKLAQREAEARLLATILVPALETLNVRLDDTFCKLWGDDTPPSSPSEEEIDLRIHWLTADIDTVRRTLPAQVELLSSPTIDAHTQRLTALPPDVVDQISITLSHLTTTKDIASEIIRCETPSPQWLIANLFEYYAAVRAAATSSATANRLLVAISARRF
ncbi:hypothetical protein [Stenotrophomonas acidaminiphila]|uniref:hypothetical protein n=1 Tax=Stenotrophomonas acidaminiphila TaxID=128780 RepID=UPI0024AE6204|nr:hypothetical protein [Stenotrophomonas acidaminiphila]WHL17606.1 hypothetical protein QLF99_11040 [Stenotrophomonas acidaminiphila]